LAKFVGTLHKYRIQAQTPTDRRADICKGLLTMQQLAAVVTWSESCELKLNNRCGNVLPSKNGRS